MANGRLIAITDIIVLLVVLKLSVAYFSIVSVEIITPSKPDQRGCQLSLRFSCLTEDVHQKLHHQGIIVSVNIVMRVCTLVSVSTLLLFI